MGFWSSLFKSEPVIEKKRDNSDFDALTNQMLLCRKMINYLKTGMINRESPPNVKEEIDKFEEDSKKIAGMIKDISLRKKLLRNINEEVNTLKAAHKIRKRNLPVEGDSKEYLISELKAFIVDTQTPVQKGF